MDGNRAHRVSRWHRYVEAAVRDTAGKDRPGGAASVDDAPANIPAAGAPVRDTIASRDTVASKDTGASRDNVVSNDTVASMRRLGLLRLSAFRDRMRSRLVPEERAAGEDGARRRRLDLRLVPAALVVWAAAGAAPWLAPAWLLGLCLVMTGAAALVLAGTLRQRRRAGMSTTGTRADGKPPACMPSACTPSACRPAGRSFPLTMAAALFLAAATAAHSAVSSAQRHEGPVAAAIAAKASSLAELEITGA